MGVRISAARVDRQQIVGATFGENNKFRPGQMASPRFSVVIPARNEAQLISRAVGSILNQSVPRESIEIIVVDNASNDNTASQAREAGADLVLYEPRVGTNMARQRGLSAAMGEYIAFLDADCEAPDCWLAAIEARLSGGRHSAVSGPYDFELDGFRGWAATLYFKRVLPIVGPAVRLVFRRSATVVIGGNFAMSRNAAKRMGELPLIRFYGDDTSISVCLAHRAGAVLYDVNLCVRSSPRRLNEEGFLPAAWRYAYHYFRVAMTPPTKLDASRLGDSARPMGLDAKSGIGKEGRHSRYQKREERLPITAQSDAERRRVEDEGVPDREIGD